MKKVIFIIAFMAFSCAKQQTHPPVGGILSEKDMRNSQNRAKNLNQTERKLILDWMNRQDEKFYPMGLNYWVNKADLLHNNKKIDGETISYQYEIYDFDRVKIYDHPKIIKDKFLGKFEEIKAVDDVTRYLNSGDEATILVPSVLAFGTYGDDDEIPNDMPLIIKIKMLE